MKIPSIFDRMLPKKTSEKEIFSSLVLDEEYVAAALWEMGDHGVPNVLATDGKPCAENTWEARLDAVDEALATVEDTVGTTKYSKVVLGLPPEFLTKEGDILKEIRPHIKTITKELELTPIGFVSVPTAIIYRIKKDEGVPPSVILLDVSKKSITVSLYRVGGVAGEVIKDRTNDTAITLEEALGEFKNLEVLPARILLYGKDAKELEEVKTELMRYPWTTRVNFLHFPKIEILPAVTLASDVSLAGASELAHEVEDEVEVPPPVPDVQNEEVLEAEAAEEEEAEEIEDAEESNVVAVDPTNLGFKKNVDVLEQALPAGRQVEPLKPRTKLPFTLPAFTMPKLPNIHLPAGKGPLVGIALTVLMFIGLLFWFVPHATVTILTQPKSLTATELITIDPTATSISGDNKIIPGKKVEKSVSGTKTIPVTGKKNVGDPAKGPITVYNKTTSDVTQKKATVLTSGSLQFTLDADVTVPAASVSGTLGSETKTFGQATGAITASAIGTESNLSASTSFSVKGYASDEMSANNASALSGGTSRSVTVVTRADQEAFIKAVSSDLIEKAKQDLSGSVTGSQKLIDDTISTAVTQKTFSQELDQEATSLTGNATVTVSGVSYNDDDVKTIMKAAITGQIPTGFTLAEDRTQVSLQNVKVAKDGKITAKATITCDAVPTLDTADIRKRVTGKTISFTQEYLKSLPGVSGVEVRFSLSLSNNRLPMNPKNITVGVAIQ